MPFQEHKAFEVDLESYKPEIQRLQDAASVLASSSPTRGLGNGSHSNGHAGNGYLSNGSSKDAGADGHHLDLVLEKWESLWDMSLVYLQRLKSAEIILAGMQNISEIFVCLEASFKPYKHFLSIQR